MTSYYKHENLLSEIHTSAGVVIICQQEWGSEEEEEEQVVIFMAEQELDGGKGKSFKKLSPGLGQIRGR